MVAMGVDEDEERRMDERPVHQGCMAGFLHLFDRPQILSGRRLHGSPRRLLSSGSSGSATPSERSMPLERATPAPSSPDMTPPAAPRPSLQLDPKDGGGGGGGAGGWAAPSWRLPRLSLDSRAVVDAGGKLRPREIRTAPAPGAPPSPSAAGDERRSPSVVARLMGLDALPHGLDAAGDGAASPAALRRSASERVPPRDPSHFRFVDPAFFERPASPLPPLVERPSPAASAPAAGEAMRRAPDPGCPRSFQRRSRFDAHEVFPEPANRADPAAAGAHGEIALYGEIERRLRKRGIAEPARDLETLKQILEALQLKGLLHHTPTPPPPVRTAPPPPPIVVMRPNHRAQPPSRLTPARRLRVDVDRARRPRSPDPSASPARSPASPARRGPHSPQRRVSPVQSPKQQQQPQPPFRRPSGFDSAGAPVRIARRAAHNAAALSPDDEASTTFSDGGSSSSFSASSRWDLEPPDSRTDRGLLERCGKLLSSIQAFTGGDAAGSDQQPSPVSVLDAAAFLADGDSPSSSSGSKRAIDFSSVGGGAGPKPPAATASSDPEDDEWALGTGPVGPEASGDPDYAYVADLVRLFGGARGSWLRDPADVYKAAEQRRRQRGGDPCDTWHHRRLLCGAVGEALERQRAACPWEPAAWLRGAELVDHVRAEVRRAGEPAPRAAGDEEEEEGEAEEDLNAVTCRAIRRDMAADEGRWAATQRRRVGVVVSGAEAAEAVLQIERLVFRDLVADTIRELADADRPLPRRKLVF
ncbi:SH3 and multiple ankyrin repeat domains protein 1-like isoform X2 [Panicum virgatum]|uniref:SH3 and multiple ankyrin repeat domains protein 1-like isoform X2 n=1 Tax=Panicum virgatum TaxID=38727 RepID=UPI0019D682B5|nr:SH3 and multiple ankyrin repeat domains protein 1-like isoform X2 [Panicum virgatum]